MSSKFTLLFALATVATTSQAVAADSSADMPEIQKGDSLHKNNKFKEAAEAFREAIRKEPGNAKAHQRLGAVLAAQSTIAPDEKTQKDLDETAELEEKQAIKLDPKYYLPHVVLGQIYANRNKNEDAVREFKAATELKPDSFRSHLDLGIAYTRMSKDEEALKAYRKAAELKPDIPVAFINMGVLQQSLGDFNSAIESEKKALALKCTPQETHAANFNLGNIYADAKQPDEAIKAYQAALKIQPAHLLSQSGIGWMQCVKGDHDAAIATQKKVLKQTKDPVMEAIARGRMATALAAKGDTAAAEKEFEKCIAIKPANPVSMMEYGRYLEKKGRKSEAKTQFERALSLQPSFKPAKEALAKLDSGKSDTK